MRRVLRSLTKGFAVFAVIASGCMVASVSCQKPSNSPTVKLSLRQFLLQADIIDIGQYGTDQKGVRILGPGVAMLHRSENAPMFLAIKASNRFHSNPPHKPADYVISVSVQNYKYEADYDYYANTGELGRDHDWCYVPAAFKDWMNKIAKPVHTKFKTKNIDGVVIVGS